jgi:hypothetical protein
MTGIWISHAEQSLIPTSYKLFSGLRTQFFLLDWLAGIAVRSTIARS